MSNTSTSERATTRYKVTGVVDFFETIDTDSENKKSYERNRFITKWSNEYEHLAIDDDGDFILDCRDSRGYGGTPYPCYQDEFNLTANDYDMPTANRIWCDRVSDKVTLVERIPNSNYILVAERRNDLRYGTNLPIDELHIYHNKCLVVPIEVKDNPFNDEHPVFERIMYVGFLIGYTGFPDHLPKNTFDYFDDSVDRYPFKWPSAASFHIDKETDIHKYSIPIHRYMVDELRDILLDGMSLEYTSKGCFLHLTRSAERQVDHEHNKRIIDLETKLARVSEWEKNNA